MAPNKRKSLDINFLYENASLKKALFFSAYPLVIANIILQLFFIISFTFIILFVRYSSSVLGPHESSSYLSRVIFQIIGPVFAGVSASSILVSTGFNILFAAQVGAKNKVKQEQVFQHAFIFLIITSAIIFTLFYFVAPFIIHNEATSINTYTYNLALRLSRLLIFGGILLNFGNFFLGYFQVYGKSSFIFLVYAISGLINVFLDCLFFVILHLSIIYAAYSVIIAWGLTFLAFFLAFVYKQRQWWKFFYLRTNQLGKSVWKLFYLGFPQSLALFGFALFGFLENVYLSHITIPSYANQMDHTYWISLFAVIFPFVNLIVAPTQGFNFTLRSFTSYLIGKQDFNKFRALMRQALIIISVYAVVLTLLFIGLTPVIFGLYGVNNSKSIIDGVILTAITLFLYPLYIIQTVLRLYYQVTHQKILTFLAYALHDCFLYPIFSFLAFLIAYYTKIPYLFFMSYMFCDIVSISIFASIYRRQIKAIKNEQFDWQKVLSAAY